MRSNSSRVSRSKELSGKALQAMRPILSAIPTALQYVLARRPMALRAPGSRFGMHWPGAQEREIYQSAAERLDAATGDRVATDHECSSEDDPSRPRPGLTSQEQLTISAYQPVGRSFPGWDQIQIPNTCSSNGIFQTYSSAAGPRFPMYSWGIHRR